MGALSRLGDGDALHLLLELVTDDDLSIRAAAVSNSLNLARRRTGWRRCRKAEARAGLARGQAFATSLGGRPLWTEGTVAAAVTEPVGPGLRHRGLVVEALAALAAPESIEALVPRLRTEDDRESASAWPPQRPP